MAKAKPKGKPGRGAPGARDRKESAPAEDEAKPGSTANALTIRALGPWMEWLEGLATKVGLDPTGTLVHGATMLARSVGYPDPPPRTKKRGRKKA